MPGVSHTDLTHLYQAIVADPADNAARHVLADALLERGDPHGELILLQLRYDELPETSPEKAKILFRIKRLLTEQGPRIAGDLSRLAGSYQLDRGFVSEVTMTAESFAKHGDRILSEHPIERLRLRPLNQDSVDALAGTETLSKLRGLVLAKHLVRDNGMEAQLSLELLLASQHLGSLTGLWIDQVDLSIERTERAFESARASLLGELHITGRLVPPRVLTKLCDNPAPPPLRRIRLSGRLTVEPAEIDQLLEALGCSHAFEHLRELCIDGWVGAPNPAFAKWFSGPNAARLERLEIGVGPNADAIALELSKREMPALVSLDFSQSTISRAGLMALMNKGLRTLQAPAGLRHLVPKELRGNQ